MNRFVHLHVHSHYSLLDALPSIKDLVNAAKNYNMHALALTDHGNLSAAYKFYRECNKQGIKPIFGCEFYISANRKNKTRENKHVILLAKDEKGWKNLTKLSSLSFMEGFYYKPRIDPKLVKENSEGLIAMSACMSGVLGKHLLNKDKEKAYKMADWWKSVFQDDFYLELIAIESEEQKYINKELILVAANLDIDFVATCDVHYINEEDYKAHRVLLKIKYPKFETDVNDLYFKNSKEIKEILLKHDLSEKFIDKAISNTVNISNEIETFKLEIDSSMPIFKLEVE